MVDLTLLSPLTEFNDASEINEQIMEAISSFGKDFNHMSIRYWTGIGWNSQVEERIYFNTFDKNKNRKSHGHLVWLNNGIFASKFEMTHVNSTTIAIKSHLIEQGFHIIG